MDLVLLTDGCIALVITVYCCHGSNALHADHSGPHKCKVVWFWVTSEQESERTTMSSFGVMTGHYARGIHVYREQVLIMLF